MWVPCVQHATTQEITRLSALADTMDVLREILDCDSEHGVADQARDLVAERDALRAQVAELDQRIALAATVARCLDATMDGTDGACPAWWRGQDDGCRGAEGLKARIAEREHAARVAELESANAEAASAIRDLEGHEINYATARRLSAATQRLDSARAKETP